MAAFMTFIMVLTPASAAVATWAGPSSVVAPTDLVSDAWNLPGNATVLDAWLNVDSDGMTSAGAGPSWDGQTPSSNFTSGLSINTTSSHFDGLATLQPNSSLGEVATFASGSFQLPTYLTDASGVWGANDLSTVSGTSSGGQRTMPFGTMPASARSGAIAVGTSIGTGLAPGTDASLTFDTIPIPTPVSNLTVSFWHAYHFDAPANGTGGDGGWLEVRVDNGPWTWVAPQGGYPTTLNSTGPSPTGASSNLTHGIGGFSSSGATSWSFSNFTLDAVPNISSGTNLSMRARAWTSSYSVVRPGWFIDDLTLTNIGNSSGYWHHGCSVQSGSCSYSNNAHAALTRSLNLSNATAGSQLESRLEWDLEGSTYDNLCIEMKASANTTWIDVSSTGVAGSTTTDCRSRSGAIPANGYTVGGQTYFDESGGFLTLSHAIPSSLLGQNAVDVRYVVQTDGSVTGGSPYDEREGVTLDWIRINDNGIIRFQDALDSSATMSHASIGTGVDDWAYLQIGAGGFTASLDFEDAPSLPPGGWSILTSSGATGWEFGALTSTSGPTTYPSPSLGFGLGLSGSYPSSSRTDLITPTYTIPTGSSARFVFDQWICSEQNYDAGALFISVNNGSWTHFDQPGPGNQTTWYDGTMANNLGAILHNLNVWDGRSNGAGCSSATSASWRSMEADLTPYSGSDLRFRFTFESDSIIAYDGWFLDDIGVEIDYFVENGTWTSPLIPWDDLGLGIVDLDAVLPENTSLQATVTDASGAVIHGFEDLDVPFSLAGAATTSTADPRTGVHIELTLATEDAFVTPMVSEITVGATRHLAPSGWNGWTLGSGLTVNGTGAIVNPGLITGTLSAPHLTSSRPIGSVQITGDIGQSTVRLLDVNGVLLGSTTGVGTVTFNTPQPGYGIEVQIPPGSTVADLVAIGDFLQPAVGPSIDVGDDGVVDWSFPTTDAGASGMGWQTRFNVSGPGTTWSNLVTSTEFPNSPTTPASVQIHLPTDAVVTEAVIALTERGSGACSTTVTMGGMTLGNLGSNWSHATIDASPMIPTLHARPAAYMDATGRNWSTSTLDLTFSGCSEVGASLGSLILGYDLQENVTGLGPVVAAHHAANNGNGATPSVDIPIEFVAARGGVGIGGGVHHDVLVQNQLLPVPATFYPSGDLQTITSRHTQLFDADDLARVTLLGYVQGMTEPLLAYEVDLTSSTPSWQQTSGAGVLDLRSVSATSMGRTWTIDWALEANWSTDDIERITWHAQGFQSDGAGFGPAIDTSGGVNGAAIENDLEVDRWTVRDATGHLLSDVGSPSYPFWSKAGGSIDIEGTIRFQGTVDLRPMPDHAAVAVMVGSVNHFLTLHPDGTFNGTVPLPEGSGTVNLTASLPRTGPITGANGSEDVSSVESVTLRLDEEPPIIRNLFVVQGTQRLPADGHTWDPASPLQLEVTIQDAQALGAEIVAHVWREAYDDGNGDGIPDPSEYQTHVATLPSGRPGERVVAFDPIPVAASASNDKVSIFLTSTDFAGHPLAAGSAGFDHDHATLVVAVNEDPRIDSASLTLDAVDDHLLAGQPHVLTMTVTDVNGVDSLDRIDVQLMGVSDTTIGRMSYDPRSGVATTPNGSHIEHLDIVTYGEGSTILLEWHFRLDWNLSPMVDGFYALPSILIFDDDVNDPVLLISNLGPLRWRYDHTIEVVLTSVVDRSPPLASPGVDRISAAPGDDLLVQGIVRYVDSGASFNRTEDGLLVHLSGAYGSETLERSVSIEAGSWSAGLILPSRSLTTPEVTLDLSLTGTRGEMVDATDAVLLIVVDDIPPIVTFDLIPTALDDGELTSVPITLSVTDSGGSSDRFVTVHWEVRRGGVAVPGATANGTIDLRSENGDRSTFTGILDWTEGLDHAFQPGDQIVWWVDVTDSSGNRALGPGTSRFDPLSPSLDVRTFEWSVSRISIEASDGGIALSDQVVPGTLIDINADVRNMARAPGEVIVRLVEEQQDGPWTVHESTTVDLSTGQAASISFEYELYRVGSTGLHLNFSGSWDVYQGSTATPNCVLLTGIVSCPLDEESDLPEVVSEDSLQSNSGTSPVSLIGGVGLILAIIIGSVILLRRTEEEYDWEEDGEWEMEKVAPELESATYLQPVTTEPALDLGSAESLLDAGDGMGSPDHVHLAEEE